MRPPVDATQLMPLPVWDDPRAQLLDNCWLLTIFAILAATALPWLASDFTIGFGAVAAGLLALGAIHVGLSALADPQRAHTRWRRHALLALHIAGLFAMAFIWQHAGGLQNPAYLIAFMLPVIGATFLSRWQPYLTALVAVLLVGIVAVAHAPELRWIADRYEGSWLADLVNRAAGGAVTPFAGFFAPSGYFVVLLEVFALLMLACAIAAEYLGTVFARLRAQTVTARAEAQRGHDLWTSLIEQLPLPALLVEADTLQVVAASAQLTEKFTVQQEPAAGRGVFEAVQFTYPEVVQELITGIGGVAQLVTLRVGKQLHVTDVRVQHVAQRGRRYALVVIDEVTEQFCVKTALDAAEQAALVVDAAGMVLAFNKPAAGLFPGVSNGIDAATIWAPAGIPARWWEPGVGGRRKQHVEIQQRIYLVTTSALPLPGEADRINVVSFVPVARSGGGTIEQTAITPALINATLVIPK